MIWSVLTFWQRLGVYVGALLLVVAAIWGYGEKRYQNGLARERTLHAAILTEINAKGEAQNKAAKAKEMEDARRFQELENRYAQLEADSRQARRDSAVRVSGLVQNLASCRVREFSQTPGDPRRIAEAARVTQRASEIGASLAAIGAAAQRDARRLALCVDTLRAERSP